MTRIYQSITRPAFATSLILIALTGVLMGSLDGLASMMAQARPDAPHFVHWGVAIAVELGVVGATLMAAAHRRRSTDARWPNITLVCVVCVSALANLGDSLAGFTGGQGTWSALVQLDPLVAALSIGMGALLPVLTLALSKTIEGSVLAEDPLAEPGQRSGIPAAVPIQSPPVSPQPLHRSDPEPFWLPPHEL